MSEPKSHPSENATGEAKCRLRSCATHLFAKFGLEGTSIRDIAKQSGLNLSLISYYFGGKAGLYRDIFAEFAQQTNERMSSLLEGFDSRQMTALIFHQQMRKLIEQMIAIQIAHPEIMTMMQRERLEGLPHARKVWDHTFHSLGERIVGILQAAQDQGLIRKDLNLQFHFLSMVHAIDMIFISHRCKGPWEKKLFRIPEEAPQIAEQIFTVFIEGISL